jgi:hypothetical protein
MLPLEPQHGPFYLALFLLNYGSPSSSSTSNFHFFVYPSSRVSEFFMSLNSLRTLILHICEFFEDSGFFFFYVFSNYCGICVIGDFADQCFTMDM